MKKKIRQQSASLLSSIILDESRLFIYSVAIGIVLFSFMI